MNEISRVAAGGDRLTTLEAIRDRLAQELDDCSYARDAAVLAQRLQSVLSEIDDFPSKVATAPADIIAARRAARRAKGTA